MSNDPSKDVKQQATEPSTATGLVVADDWEIAVNEDAQQQQLAQLFQRQKQLEAQRRDQEQQMKAVVSSSGRVELHMPQELMQQSNPFGEHEPQRPFRLLRRPQKSTQMKNDANEAAEEAIDKFNKMNLSLQEREAAYQQARERIFGAQAQSFSEAPTLNCETQQRRLSSNKLQSDPKSTEEEDDHEECEQHQQPRNHLSDVEMVSAANEQTFRRQRKQQQPPWSFVSVPPPPIPPPGWQLPQAQGYRLDQQQQQQQQQQQHNLSGYFPSGYQYFPQQVPPFSTPPPPYGPAPWAAPPSRLPMQSVVPVCLPSQSNKIVKHPKSLLEIHVPPPAGGLPSCSRSMGGKNAVPQTKVSKKNSSRVNNDNRSSNNGDASPLNETTPTTSTYGRPLVHFMAEEAVQQNQQQPAAASSNNPIKVTEKE